MPKPTRPIDNSEWVKWAQAKTEENLKTMPQLKPLQDKLLSLGGDWVALQPECDLEELLKKGHIIKGKVILETISSNKNCHSECSCLWYAFPEVYQIATGWALSNDGIWRQHTWLLQGKNIIETTLPRTTYFGITLDYTAAYKFWWINR